MSLKLVFGVAVALTLLALSSGESLYAEQPSFRGLVKCDYNENPGLSCFDCNTVLFCTKLGGVTTKCWLPGSNNCDNGVCGPDPSEECTSTTSSPEPPTTRAQETSTVTAKHI